MIAERSRVLTNHVRFGKDVHFDSTMRLPRSEYSRCNSK